MLARCSNNNGRVFDERMRVMGRRLTRMRRKMIPPTMAVRMPPLLDRSVYVD
jgi:hypothetical protein